MIKELLHVEGPVIGFLDKIGQLIVLSVLWILGCIPLVTIGTSNAALYYAVVKSIRRGQGNAIREFWRSYRANLGRGIPITAVTAGLGILLAVNLGILRGGSEQPLLAGGTLMGLVLLGFIWMYIGPVLSRFHMKCTDVWKLAFVMSIRFVHYTVLFLAGIAALAVLQIYFLPIPTIIFLPGMWCYLVSFLMENVLRRYMPPKEENDNTWYYEI